MEAHFSDELLLLGNALRNESFRFILVSHNRRSIYVDTTEWLTQQFGSHRTIVDFSFNGKKITAIRDAVVSLNKGILIISDLDFIFRPENADLCTYFNQRRDFFARFDIAFICFIQPSSFPILATKLPDWWSLRSLELEFVREEPETGLVNPNQLESFESSVYSNLTPAEKTAEIDRLKRQVEQTDHNNKVLLGSLYGLLGQLLYLSSQFDSALLYYEQALAIQQEIGNRQGEGATLNNISQIYQARGDYDTALRYLEQSLGIMQEIGDRQGEGTTLNNISQIYDAKGDYDTALRYLEQSLGIKKEIGDRQGEGVTLNNISQIYDAKGDYDTALGYLEQSLGIRQEIGDRKGEGTTLNNLATIAHAKGDYETALRYLEQSLGIQQEIGDRQGEGTTLNNIGQIYKARGDYDAALRYLEQSLGIRQEIGDRQGEGATLNNISQIYDARGDYDTALRYLEQSLGIQQEIGDRQGEGTTLNNIGQIYMARGDYDTALGYLEQSLGIQQEIGDIAGLAITLSNMGDIYLNQQNDIESAVKAFLQSYQIFQQIGSPDSKVPESYLKNIMERIGEARFKKIIGTEGMLMLEQRGFVYP